MPPDDKDETEEKPPSPSDLKALHEHMGSHYALAYLSSWCEGAVRAGWATFLHEVFVGEQHRLLQEAEEEVVMMQFRGVSRQKSFFCQKSA